MSIAGNPKKIAEDIGDGYQSLNDAVLKKYNQQDLKTILTNLQIVQRELRAQQVDLNDVMAAKSKNTKMSRVNQAMTILQAFAKKRRIQI